MIATVADPRSAVSVTVEGGPVFTVSAAPVMPVSVTIGGVQGPAGAPGASGADAGAVALAAHVASSTPHPAYDLDMQDLSTLFENGLI